MSRFQAYLTHSMTSKRVTSPLEANIFSSNKNMFYCEYCTMSSKYIQSVIRHMQNKHRKYICDVCELLFNNDKELTVHSLNEHNKCLNCDRSIDKKNFKRHIEKCDKKLCRKYDFIDDVNIKSKILVKLNNSPLPIKWLIIRIVHFIKYTIDSDGTKQIEKETSAPFRSVTATTTIKKTFITQVDEALTKIDQSIQNFQRDGSGWIIDTTESWQLYIYKYNPMYAKSYIPTPSKIIRSKAIVNIRNEDNKCFLWSVLAALHKVKANAERVNHYFKYERELKIDKYPVSLADIDRFEKQNSVSVNVLIRYKGLSA